MHFYQALQRNASTLPNKIATSYKAREHSWKEVEQRVAKLAGALHNQGVNAKEHIAILSLNSDRYFEYFSAIPWMGGVVVPLNIRWSLKENIYSVENSQSTILFVDDAFLEMGLALKKACPKLRLMIYMGDGETPEGMLNYEALIVENNPIEPIYSDYDELAGIFYTGGTTGFPKGVMLSHTNLWTSSVSVSVGMAYNNSDESYLHAAPMFHLADIGVSYATLIGGLKQVFIPFFEPNSLIETISEKQVNHTLLVPTMVTILLATPALENANFSSLKSIIYGASPMPEGTLINAMDKMPTVSFTQAYGQSELSPLISILPAEYHVLEGEKSGKLRSAGRPGYCVNVEIKDSEGNTLPRGEIGEIAARGPNKMLGYWNNPEQTESTIVNGWVMTGDAGYMDEDGFIFLVDRVKDMIISGGENIFSAEVENALSHHPAILESVAIGIPSQKWGEAVHAIIRLHEDTKLTEAEVIKHCREYIAGYKVPRSVEFRQAPFPMTGAGKLKKNEIRDSYWTEQSRAIN